MIKKIKNHLAALFAIAALAFPVMVPVAVHAQTAAGDDPIASGVCGGTNLQFSSATDCTSGDSTQKLSDLITTIINIVSIVVGVVAVVMIIFGGLKYITSGGDSSNVSAAKNTIIYAIIGLVIVALSQFIVHFVLEKSLTAGN